MPKYTLYCLRSSQLVSSCEISAPNDTEAVRIAGSFAQNQIVEVWEGRRRVEIVSPRAA